MKIGSQRICHSPEFKKLVSGSLTPELVFLTLLYVGFPSSLGLSPCCSWDDDKEPVTSLLWAALVTPMPGKWALSASLPWEPAAKGDFSAMLLQSTRMG